MSYHPHSFIGYALLILACSAFATTYYVDGPNPAASDSNPGTEALPLKTIQKGVDLAVAGDRVFVKAGAYAENLVMKNSGVEGNPIVIEAQKGTNGERLVTIEAGRLARNWTAAPEVGIGVYKSVFFDGPYAIKPGAITIDGEHLDRFNEIPGLHGNNPIANMEDDSWKPYFASDPNLDVNVDNPCNSTPACTRQMKFWDLTHGIFGAKSDGNVYIRLKDRSNPNNYNTRVSNNAITFDNHRHIIFKGFELRSVSVGFQVTGANTHDVIIEDNFISGGVKGITIGSGAHDIIIRNNEVYFDHYGFKNTGAWKSNGDYEDDLMQAFYQWRHHWIFRTANSDGFSIGGGASDIEISNNFIHGGNSGFELGSEAGTISSRVKISKNKIEDFSNTAIVIRSGLVDLEIFDNNFYNNHINIRFHHLNEQNPRKVFIYKNLIRNPEGSGSMIFFHWFSNYPVPNPQPEGYIYHNSFSGAETGLTANSIGYQYGLLPNFYIINNLISTPYAFNPQTSSNYREEIHHHFIGSFNYNWVGNLVKGLEWKYGVGKVPPWFGPNNIQSPSNFFWLPPGGSDFGISADSNVVDRGLDLSRAQDINGKTIGPLPGITGDYYCGSAPDIGAVQYCPVVAGCGDGVCVAGETPASCAADCNSGAVNCGTKGKFCAQNEYCSSGVCIKNGCPASPIDFAKLKTYEGSWLNRLISMVEFMAKILEWKRCNAGN